MCLTQTLFQENFTFRDGQMSVSLVIFQLHLSLVTFFPAHLCLSVTLGLNLDA